MEEVEVEVRGRGVRGVKVGRGGGVVELWVGERIEEVLVEYVRKVWESGVIVEGMNNVGG